MELAHIPAARLSTAVAVFRFRSRHRGDTYSPSQTQIQSTSDLVAPNEVPGSFGQFHQLPPPLNTNQLYRNQTQRVGPRDCLSASPVAIVQPTRMVIKRGGGCGGLCGDGRAQLASSTVGAAIATAQDPFPLVIPIDFPSPANRNNVAPKLSYLCSSRAVGYELVCRFRDIR